MTVTSSPVLDYLFPDSPLIIFLHIPVEFRSPGLAVADSIVHAPLRREYAYFSRQKEACLNAPFKGTKN